MQQICGTFVFFNDSNTTELQTIVNQIAKSSIYDPQRKVLVFYTNSNFTKELFTTDLTELVGLIENKQNLMQKIEEEEIYKLFYES